MKKLLVLSLFTTCSFCKFPDYVLKAAIESSWIAHASAIYKYKKEECERFGQERYMESVLNVIGTALSKVAIGADTAPKEAKVTTQAEYNYMFLCKLAQIYMNNKDKTKDLDTLLKATYEDMQQTYNEKRLRKAKHDISEYAKTFEIMGFLKHIGDIKEPDSEIMKIETYDQYKIIPCGFVGTYSTISSDGKSSKSSEEIIKTAIISGGRAYTDPRKSFYEFRIISFVDMGENISNGNFYETDGVASLMVCSINAQDPVNGKLIGVKTDGFYNTYDIPSNDLTIKSYYDILKGVKEKQLKGVKEKQRLNNKEGIDTSISSQLINDIAVIKTGSVEERMFSLYGTVITRGVLADAHNTFTNNKGEKSSEIEKYIKGYSELYNDWYKTKEWAERYIKNHNTENDQDTDINNIEGLIHDLQMKWHFIDKMMEPGANEKEHAYTRKIQDQDTYPDDIKRIDIKELMQTKRGEKVHVDERRYDRMRIQKYIIQKYIRQEDEYKKTAVKLFPSLAKVKEISRDNLDKLINEKRKEIEMEKSGQHTKMDTQGTEFKLGDRPQKIKDEISTIEDTLNRYYKDIKKKRKELINCSIPGDIKAINKEITDINFKIKELEKEANDLYKLLVDSAKEMTDLTAGVNWCKQERKNIQNKIDILQDELNEQEKKYEAASNEDKQGLSTKIERIKIAIEAQDIRKKRIDNITQLYIERKSYFNGNKEQEKETNGIKDAKFGDSKADGKSTKTLDNLQEWNKYRTIFKKESGHYYKKGDKKDALLASTVALNHLIAQRKEDLTLKYPAANEISPKFTGWKIDNKPVNGKNKEYTIKKGVEMDIADVINSNSTNGAVIENILNCRVYGHMTLDLEKTISEGTYEKKDAADEELYKKRESIVGTHNAREMNPIIIRIFCYDNKYKGMEEDLHRLLFTMDELHDNEIRYNEMNEGLKMIVEKGLEK